MGVRGCPTAASLLHLDVLVPVARAAGAEPGVDEAVDVAVEHALGVARANAGAKVLHHLVGLEDVAADLAAEIDAQLGAGDLLQLGLAPGFQLGPLCRLAGQLGLALLLPAWAVPLAALWPSLGPLLFVLYINRFQIAPEERVLKELFGEEYVAYTARVRRWL